MGCMCKRNNPSKKFLDAWKNQLKVTRINLRDVLSWTPRNNLERLEKKLRQNKLKKLGEFCKNDNLYFECLERFASHKEFFSSKYNLFFFSFKYMCIYIYICIYLLYYIIHILLHTY